MAKRPRVSQARQLADLVKKYEAELSGAFLEAVRKLTDGVVIAEMVARLEAGDIDGAIKALGIHAASFRELDLSYQAAFEAAGVSAISAMPTIRNVFGVTFRVIFDVRNPVAEKLLAEKSSAMVTNLTEGARSSIRSILVEGLAKGDNPKALVGKIVGRYDATAGRRMGGVIGLNSQQANAVSSAREALQAGDYTNYLTRAARDKRFDRMVINAMEEGRQLAEAEISKLITRYSDGLLRVRAETVGLTETMTAINDARFAAFSQIQEEMDLPHAAAVKIWKTAHDDRVRPDHAAMDGVEVTGMASPFVLPDGTAMLYPTDSSLGAEGNQTIRCRCTMFVRMDFMAGLT